MPKILFNYFNDFAYNVAERPAPANKFIPNWHKEMATYAPNEMEPWGNKLSVKDSGTNTTAKKCIPMLDAISGGYIVPLWADVHVKQTPQGPYLSWKVDKEVFALHGSPHPGMPTPLGFHPMVFKYATYFRIETPEGYSTMIRPPAGHYNLPIEVVPAVVDTDKSVIDSNFPCWFRTDFEGVIEMGTPIAQVIPFKRDNWKAEFSQIDENKYIYQLNKGFLNTLKNNYVKRYWSQKKYE